MFFLLPGSCAYTWSEWIHGCYTWIEGPMAATPGLSGSQLAASGLRVSYYNCNDIVKLYLMWLKEIIRHETIKKRNYLEWYSYLGFCDGSKFQCSFLWYQAYFLVQLHGGYKVGSSQRICTKIGTDVADKVKNDFTNFGDDSFITLRFIQLFVKYSQYRTLLFNAISACCYSANMHENVGMYLYLFKIRWTASNRLCWLSPYLVWQAVLSD